MSAQSDTPRTDELWEVKYNPDGSDLAWTVPKGKAALMLSRELERELAALRAPQAAPQDECEEGHCLIAEAEGSTYQCSGKCAYSTPSIEQLISNDSFAMTFQNIGQYRTALLKNISAKRKNHG